VVAIVEEVVDVDAGSEEVDAVVEEVVPPPSVEGVVVADEETTPVVDDSMSWMRMRFHRYRN
jgi:hypothetical protein